MTVADGGSKPSCAAEEQGVEPHVILFNKSMRKYGTETVLCHRDQTFFVYRTNNPSLI